MATTNTTASVNHAPVTTSLSIQSSENAGVVGCRPRADGTACRAYVSVMVDGIRINGVRIIERGDGSLYARLPNQRDRDGRWFPVVELREDVTRQVLDAAMEAYWRV